MADAERTFVSVDQLPDNPSAMPPPYWRSGGSEYHLNEALRRLVELLGELLNVTPDVRRKVDEFRQAYEGAEGTDEYSREIRRVYDPAWQVDTQIMLKSELANLMAAIYAEELVNRFLVYNVPRELVEAIEKLSPAEKLVAAASHLGQIHVRSNAAYAAVGELFKWRNAFAHGHCVDRPTKSLRHNHLITPEDYIGLPEAIAAVIRCLNNLKYLVRYLAEISVNLYTMSAVDVELFSRYRAQIEQFRISGSPVLYDVSIERKGA